MEDKKKRVIEKIIILTLAVVVLTLLVLFLKDIFFPFIKLEIKRDVDGAKELLISKGFLGGLTVTVIEALQMVVIFIPAEFIQLSSGMSYPWWLAIILCDFGVILGASIIYFIVHVFKFNGDIFNKSKKIKKYDKGKNEKSIMVLMYFLFFMPIIPFGAICYYSSNKKISYPKYIFTCATGVIPSIVTSIIMGKGVRAAIENVIPIWALILIIVGAAAILFVLILFILSKFYFKENDKTPDSPFYSFIMKVAGIYLKFKTKIKVNQNGVEQLEEPYVLLFNHASFFDFYYVNKVDPERHFAYILNRHIYNKKFIGSAAKHVGFIPKRIFDPDFDTVKGCIKMKKKGYSIVMAPEGRLSNDGTLNVINKGTGDLVKILNMPLVLVRVSGAYLTKPKWRFQFMRGKITVDVVKIIDTETLKSMSVKEINEEIKNALTYNDFECGGKFKSKNKAKGLDNLLYACPHCKTLYKTAAKGNVITCEHCGKSYEIGKDYSFTGGEIKNIHEYFSKIEEMERENLDGLNIKISVTTKIFNKDDNGFERDEGVFTLNESGISYESTVKEYKIDIALKQLEGIAYSVNEEFEFYHEGRLHYFYPKDNKKICTRIALVYDLLKERESGRKRN